MYTEPQKTLVLLHTHALPMMDDKAHMFSAYTKEPNRASSIEQCLPSLNKWKLKAKVLGIKAKKSVKFSRVIFMKNYLLILRFCPIDSDNC